MIFVLLLLGVTAVWGWTFVLVKDAIAQYPTPAFLAIRFALATLVLVLAIRRFPSRRELMVGTLAGVALALGYLFQTTGLAITSPGNAGLITGLVVVVAPLIDHFFGGLVHPRTWVAVVGAGAGGVLLVSAGVTPPNIGDGLVSLCAIAFAIQLVLLSRYAPGLRPAHLAMVQMGVAAVMFMFIGAPSIKPPSGSVWFAIVITAVFASALAFFIQTWAQTHLSAGRTALILATEPAWAVAFAMLLAGQRLTWFQGVGAALVIASILGHEIRASLELKVQHGAE